MTIWKKAISVGTTAALLASLLITAVAPAALASVTVTSAGDVPMNGTSAGTVTFVFTEQAKDSFANGTGTFDVVLTDSADASTISFSGTPVVAGPDSLGATATIPLVDTLRVKFTGSDTNNIESITVTGLKLKATSTAATGAIKATLGNLTGAIDSLGDLQSGGNASGFLATGVAIGQASATVNVTTTACTFVNTAGDPGAFKFAVGVAGTSAESLEGTAGALATGQQVLTINPPTVAGFASAHNAGDVVTQADACTPNGVLGSPGKVVETATYSSDLPLVVYPGENNGRAADLYVSETQSAGFLAKGTTLTFTVATEGVVLSRTPSVHVNSGNIEVSAAVLSSDRKSFVVTVTKASTAKSEIHIDGIRYDVASTVAGGTYVSVGLVISGSLVAKPASNDNAIVFRGVTASAPTPTVYIGENNQASGLITITEGGAGFFQSGTGTNNVLEVCPIAVDYTFTVSPWAKVTAGDLKLREGDVVSPDNIVQGTQDGDCYYWTVWTASTAASTIVVGDSAFASGPFISVKTHQAPGVVAARIYSGDAGNFDETLIATVGFANAVYRSQVAVTALAQPIIPAGVKSKAGAIQIAETANGQLKQWEALCFEIVPRGSIGSPTTKYDTYIQSLTTADLPVVTASGGLVVGPVEFSEHDCAGQAMNGSFLPTAAYVGTKAISFSFDVLQQSTSGAGKVVVDNINLVPLADAAAGPVLFNVYGFGGRPTKIDFQAQVSNAKIGVKPAISIAANSALGNNPTSGYSTKTPKSLAVGGYVTWKFTGGTALAGQRVNILVAKKINGAWTGPYYLKSAWADSHGIVTFVWKSSSPLWINVRAQWPGSSTNGVSTSKALAANWQ